MSKVIINNVRTEVQSYFHLSGIRETKRLSHHPFIVFTEAEDIKVEIIDSAKELLEKYPDETKVLAQWGGQWSSDFFTFTVGQLREFIKNNPKEEYYVV